MGLSLPTESPPDGSLQYQAPGRTAPAKVYDAMFKNVDADGVNVFYREAGPTNAPVILLLHGYPTSSHQYRNLIPLLAHKYRVIAPDFPSYGFTTVPAERNYAYTFANLATTTLAFLDALKISSFSVYIFDYGAPVALRIALQRPSAIKAIISQNGNAYTEGLGPAWAPIQKYWKSGSEADRQVIENAVLNLEGTKSQYTTGAAHPDQIAPETYNLDWALLQRPGEFDIQLDLFKDYATNVKMYPEFQAYFRKSQVPLLAVWGKNDLFFIPAGAEAFKRDLKNAEVSFLDAGHFAVEEYTREIAKETLEFLKKNNI
ncbi:MAG: hypothetical protein M1829_002385 [Trizodia sp. TS-e1964]|nr:MAG: hypothetical protein M1829_002385 [Trizodia sp. TS-e1964]